MNRPKHRPRETHCRVCGTQLEVEHPGRTRVRGPLDHRQWQANMVCPGCGDRSGGGQSVTLMFRHPPRNPFMRLLLQLKQLRHRRQYARLTDSLRTRDLFVGDDGRLNLAKLLAAAPFPVYGLKGRPSGLRLRSPGWGGKGSPSTIDHVSFGYVAGHPNQPEKAVDIEQGLNVEHDTTEPGTEGGLMRAVVDLNAIEGLVHNYASKERQDSLHPCVGLRPPTPSHRYLMSVVLF